MIFNRALASNLAGMILLTSSNAVQSSPAISWQGFDSDSTRNHRINARLQLETVGDEVGYAPNLEEGEYASEQMRSRYKSALLNLEWRLTDKIKITGQLQQRKLTSKRDEFDLNAYSLGINYRFSGNNANNFYLWSLGVYGNHSSIFDKNSYTRYGESLLTSVQIKNPYDLTFHSNLSTVVELNSTFQWATVTGVGYSVTGHSDISGYGESGSGCQYQFEVGDGNGNLQQIGPCGDVLAFSQEFPNYKAVQNSLGFDPDKDIDSRSVFVLLGGSLQKVYGDVDTSLGYYYQRFNRGKFDDRIENKGNLAIIDNHTLAARMRYHYSEDLNIGAQIEYNRRQLLNQVPLLYTGITSDKFSSDVVFFSLSLSFTIL